MKLHDEAYESLNRDDAIKVAKLLSRRTKATYDKLYSIVQSGATPTKSGVWEAIRYLIGTQEAPDDRYHEEIANDN